MQPKCDTGVYDPILRSHPQVSGYRLIARRGRGGVAEVWEAESPGEHRVALKLVHLSTDLRSGELRALKITRGIRHPGLVVVHGAWQVENLLVISMELADRSLWDRFLEANIQGLRGIPRGELLGYLDPVAVAIDYLNGSRHTIDGRQGVGIQHRDLKPQNLLLFGDRAKVADFGMARVMEGCVTSHSGPCTVPYAAPEYFGGRTSRHSDQYALAVTYCQLRGGRIPFPGTTAQMAVGHMCNDPDLEGLPEPERPVLARALAKRPEERWPDCRSFVDALKVIGSAGGCSIPDALPRGRHGGSSVRDGADESSALGLDPAEADFIPVDSCELESTDDIESADLGAGFWRGRAGFNSAPQIETWILERLSRYGDTLRNRLRARRPTGTRTGRRAAEEAAVRRPWSARLEQIPGLVAVRLDRLRQIDGRVAQRAAARSKWMRIGSIAVLVVLGLALANLVWTWATQQRHAEPYRIVAVAEDAAIYHQADATSGSDEPDIAQEPILETPTVAARPEAPVIRAVSGPTGMMPQTPIDPPEPKKIVPAVLRLSAEPKASTPETQVVAAGRPDVPSGEYPIGSGLKSTWTWLQQSGLIRLPSTPAMPASHPARTNGRAPGIDPPGSPVDNAERRRSDGSVAPGIATPIMTLPTKVEVTAGTEARLHIRVLRRDVAKPVRLDLRGLPRGITAAGLTIPTGADSTDVVLTSSADPTEGIAELKVAFTTGSERGEAATRINVRPPPPATVAYRRGLAALYVGSCDRSIAEFSEVIRLDPNSFGARFYRGISYALAGRSQEALADCTTAIQLRPDNPAAYSERARVYVELGEKTLALSDYTEVIRLRPDAEAYLARGSLHHELGSYDQALADCDRALRLRRGDSRAFSLRGLTRYHSGDYAGAVADFTEVIRLDPKDAGAYRARGDAYARLRKSAEAGADHENFERLSRSSGAGVANQSGVSTGDGGPGAGRGQPP
jgi:Flp pilus assembly protein TadD